MELKHKHTLFQKLNIFLLPVATVSLVSCGGGSSDSVSRGDITSGTWTTCITSDFGSSQLYTAFQDGQGLWEDTFVSYSDPDCTTLDESEDVDVYSGAYELGNQFRLEDGTEVYEVTWFTENDLFGEVDGVEEFDTCYSILSVEDDLLFLGVGDEIYDCSSPELRFIELDYERPLNRE